MSTILNYIFQICEKHEKQTRTSNYIFKNLLRNTLTSNYIFKNLLRNSLVQRYYFVVIAAAKVVPCYSSLVAMEMLHFSNQHHSKNYSTYLLKNGINVLCFNNYFWQEQLHINNTNCTPCFEFMPNISIQESPA